MYTYAYQARDNHGKITAGVQDALNEDNAITSLMSRGLMVLTIQQKSAAKKVKHGARIKETDMVLFTRQLATMIDAGIPLVGATTALYETADPRKQKALRDVIADVTARVQGGESFNAAIAKHPNNFDRLYISMVRAGESGGLLAEILDRLAGFLEASARLRKKVKSAMTYPVAVISIAVLITTFLIVKVVPVFAEIFKDFGKPLPAPTQFLVDLSDFMRNDWYFLIGGLIALFFGLRYFLRTKQGNELWNRWQLKLPIFGALIHKICMSRFARTFAQLIRSGVPILETLEIVGGSAGNTVVEGIHQGRQRRRGKGRQPFRGDVQEDHLPADDAAHGVCRREHGQDRRDARKDGRLLGRRNRGHAFRADEPARTHPHRGPRRDRRRHRHRAFPPDLPTQRSGLGIVVRPVAGGAPHGFKRRFHKLYGG